MFQNKPNASPLFVSSCRLLEIGEESESISIPLFRLSRSFSERGLLLLRMKEECERQESKECMVCRNRISLSNVIAWNQATAKSDCEAISLKGRKNVWSQIS